MLRLDREMNERKGGGEDEAASDGDDDAEDASAGAPARDDEVSRGASSTLPRSLVVRVTPSLARARRKLTNIFARLQKVRHTHLPLWPALLADHLRGRWLLLICGRWLLIIRGRWLLPSALPI